MVCIPLASLCACRGYVARPARILFSTASRRMSIVFRFHNVFAGRYGAGASNVHPPNVLSRVPKNNTLRPVSLRTSGRRVLKCLICDGRREMTALFYALLDIGGGQERVLPTAETRRRGEQRLSEGERPVAQKQPQQPRGERRGSSLRALCVSVSAICCGCRIVDFVLLLLSASRRLRG